MQRSPAPKTVLRLASGKALPLYDRGTHVAQALRLRG